MDLFTIHFLDILFRKQPAFSMTKDRGTVIVYLVSQTLGFIDLRSVLKNTNESIIK